ncbi:ABC transporter substrate-binding protein [Patescibacteria group bacterium]
MNLRYILRLVPAFLSRFKAIIGLGVLFGVILFFVFRFVVPNTIGKQNPIIALSGRYTTNNLPNSILNLVSDGLTKINPDGTLEPSLADSWETSDKGKTWVFHLRDDIFWQDGKKVTSQTITYLFSDLSIETPDEKTIIFKLQSPYSAFPAVVSKPVFKKGLLGTGKWEVKSIDFSGSYVQKLTLEDENKNKKTIKFYPTEEQAKLSYKLGSVNKIDDLINPKPLDNWRNTKATENIQKDKYVAVFFNTQDKHLSEKSIRQALSYAIDKNEIGGKRAIGPLSPNSWAYNPQVKPYEYDPKRAKDLINELPAEAKENLEINLSTSPILLSKAELIAKYWENIGVKTNVQVVSGVPSEFQALLVIFDIPKDPDQYSVWHSTQTSTNITNYQSPRIDKLLEDGRTTLGVEERRTIYLDYQRFLVEDSPAVFLYHPSFYTVERN